MDFRALSPKRRSIALRTIGGITQVCIEHYAEALELAPGSK